MPPRPRILHVPTNVGNNPWAISRAERKLGFESDVVLYKDHIFFDNFDENLKLNYFSIPGEIKKINFFRKAIKKYDIFHFNWGLSMLDYPYIGLDYLDFALLKKAGKKIIITYQGDDARQKDFFQSHFGQGPYPAQTYSSKDYLMDWRRRKRIQKVNKYADHIFALNPDLLYVLPPRAEFQPYSFEMPKETIISKKSNRRFKIIHAPSHRFAKGTDEIIKAITKLQKKYPIDFTLVEKLRRNQAEKFYRDADLAIDQVIVGWYGFFAVEMMNRGVPVVAYLRKEDLMKFVPFYKEVPILNANKNDLCNVISKFLDNPSERKNISEKSQRFVASYHDSMKIAQRITDVYTSLF